MGGKVKKKKYIHQSHVPVSAIKTTSFLICALADQL